MPQTDKQLALPVTLLYSVKNLSEGVFISELSNLSELRIIDTETEGRLDETKIKKYCPDWRKRTWWICGPPAMVEAVTIFSPPGKVKSEEFTGY